ncbi:MAG: hypothetical protein JST58_17395 [Bacteroidetes bacterium]|nr:hypothetical protein [Bacteroidota bacterium]
MVLLQAAIGFGFLLMLIFGLFIFIGIPLLANIFIGQLNKKRVVTDKKTKIIIWIEGLLIAILIVAIILFLIWELLLSHMDLTYS